MLTSDIPELPQEFLDWYKHSQLCVTQIHIVYRGYLAYEEINKIKIKNPGEEKDDPNN
jgi:hypothetical protein